MREKKNRKTETNQSNCTGEFVRGSTSEGSTEITEFGELQNETDEISIDKLIQDPAYLDFLDSFGALEMDEDSISLDELVEGVNNSDDVVKSTLTGEPDNQEHSTSSTGSNAVDELLETLDNERISEDQQAEFREILGIQNQRRVEVQFNHLKSRFLDLEAYIRAMEDLFDSDTDILKEINEIQNELASVRTEMATQIDRLDTIEQEVEALANNQEQHEDDLASVEQSLEETRGALQQNFKLIESELKTTKRWRTQVSEAFQTPNPDRETTKVDRSTSENQ